MVSIHAAILSSILIFFLLSNVNNGYGKFLSFTVFVVFMTCYSGARDIYWGDTNNYRIYFFDPQFNDFELGFEMVTSYLLGLGFGFREYIFSFALFNSIIYSVAILKWNSYLNKITSTSNNAMSLVFMVSIISFHTYYMSFEAIRDGVATGIVLIALLYLAKERKFMFVLLIVLAALFHKVSLLFLPLVILVSFRLTTRRMLFLLCLALMVTIFVLPLLRYLPFISKELVTVLEYYANNNSNSKTVLIRYALILAVLFYYMRFLREDYLQVLSIIFYTALICLVFLSLPDMSRRLLIKLEYISYPVIILVGFTKAKFKFKFKLLSYVLVLFVYLFFFSNYISFYNLLNIPPMKDIF